MYKIAVIGLWHLGEIYSVGLSELGHKVVGIDNDKKVVDELSRGVPPLAEPKLEELLKKNIAANQLSYSTDFEAIKECDVIWITLDTPVDENDEVDLEPVIAAIRKSLPYLEGGVSIVVSSQIPVGTSKKIKELVAKERPELKFDYAYSPENLRLGDAVKCFLEPGRVVVGADDENALTKMKEILSPLKAEIVSMSSASAEMAKHALNAYLATSISFTNDLADVAEMAGADIEDVIKALKSDPRIGPKAYLFAGLGFSGGTLGRDLKALIKNAKENGIDLPVIEGVFEKNKSRNDLVGKRLTKELGGVNGKTLALFGVTYKAGTSTLRRSQPLEIEKMLRGLGATLRLYDPLALPEEVGAITTSMFFRDPYEAAEGSDAVLVMTPSSEYKSLDFKKLASTMKAPLIFDTCNILCSVESTIIGFGIKYISIGR